MLTQRDSPESGAHLKKLADVLMKSYAVSQPASTLEDAIRVYKQALKLLLEGHQHHSIAVSDLGHALWYLCSQHEGDDARAARCIHLLRDVVRLRPEGHPMRDEALSALGKALFDLTFEQGQGLQDVIAESVNLNREALHLRPPGHPNRPTSLSNLANALWRSFESSGDLLLLSEVINLHCAALKLRPPGHTLRATSLISLGNVFSISFIHQGHFEHLEEGIVLLREAVPLCEVGHPFRFMALDNLAIALVHSFRHQGHSEAMSEALQLQRETLFLVPQGHPGHARMMCNLAESLLTSFREMGEAHCLAEAQSFFRQALNLTPPENAFRGEILRLLADALQVRFDHYGGIETLTEAIVLQRQGLLLYPSGHWKRLASLENLARMLCRPECLSWVEAHALYSEALTICPTGYPSRARLLSGMSICYLDPNSPFFSPSQGLGMLNEGYTDGPSYLSQRLRFAVSDLQRVEAAYGATFRASHTSSDVPGVVHDCDPVLELYSQVISLLPRVANFGLDHRTRLRAMAGTDEIARNAAARALRIYQVSQAVEILEEGRGVFWAQALHLRSTVFEESDPQSVARCISPATRGEALAGCAARRAASTRNRGGS
jgi:tetratricopeptide (TPR) repeat protein